MVLSIYTFLGNDVIIKVITEGMRMEKSLLFISKYPEIIDEFTREMAGQDIDIDVANNGIDAAILLRKKEYQIVVTGLTMDGFNGEQIITYVNRAYPDTVCIIYTTTISPAQLYFFVNERDVFRVFLRPVNFRKEFFEALSDAFEYNSLKKKDREEEEERKKLLQKNKNAIREMEGFLVNQMHGWKGLEDFGKKVINFTMEEKLVNVDAVRREKLREIELDMVEKACHETDERKMIQMVGEALRIMEKI